MFIKIIFSIVIISFLMIISYQDFKYKAVTWILYPLAFFSMLIYSLFFNLQKFFLFDFILNLLLCTCMLLLLNFYIFLRKQNKKLLDSFGLGDILFLPTLCAYFNFLNFLIYFALANLIILILSVILYQKKINNSLIPFAGFHALFLTILLIINLLKTITL